jgi:hypothetical protein
MCDVMAQNNTQDVIYLKNGGIMRGSIMEMVPDKYIKIKTNDGNVFVYQTTEIEKIVQEPAYEPKLLIMPDSTGLKRGYYGVFEYGFGYTMGYANGPFSTKINIINGYRICPWFATGIGVGVRVYFQEGLYIPVFADLRANLLNRKTSPYISLDIGYGFRTNNSGKGGFLISPSIGVCNKLKNNIAVNLGLSYELQQTSYDRYYYNNANHYTMVTEDSHTLSFLFGISF